MILSGDFFTPFFFFHCIMLARIFSMTMSFILSFPGLCRAPLWNIHVTWKVPFLGASGAATLECKFVKATSRQTDDIQCPVSFNHFRGRTFDFIHPRMQVRKTTSRTVG